MVEAVGIEPTSRYPISLASTFIVAALDCRLTPPGDRLSFAYPMITRCPYRSLNLGFPPDGQLQLPAGRRRAGIVPLGSQCDGVAQVSDRDNLEGVVYYVFSGF